MEITRRALLATIAGLTLDPERKLWIPGRRVYSIPAPQVREWPGPLCPLGRYGPPTPEIEKYLLLLGNARPFWSIPDLNDGVFHGMLRRWHATTGLSDR
jgi:hypothetical protein